MNNSKFTYKVFDYLEENEYITLDDVAKLYGGAMADAFDMIKFLLANGAIEDLGGGKFKVIADRKKLIDLRFELHCYKWSMSEERLQEIADMFPPQMLAVIGFLERTPGATYGEIRDFVCEVVDKDPLYFLATNGIVAMEKDFDTHYYCTIPQEMIDKLPKLIAHSMAERNGLGPIKRLEKCGYDSWDNWFYPYAEYDDDEENKRTDPIVMLIRKLCYENYVNDDAVDELDDENELFASDVAGSFKDRIFEVVFENSQGAKLVLPNATIHSSPRDWLGECIGMCDDDDVFDFFNMDIGLAEARETKCVAIGGLIRNLTVTYNDEVGIVDIGKKLDSKKAEHLLYKYLMRYGALKIKAEIETDNNRIDKFRLNQRIIWCIKNDVNVTFENENGDTISAPVSITDDISEILRKVALESSMDSVKRFFGEHFVSANYDGILKTVEKLSTVCVVTNGHERPLTRIDDVVLQLDNDAFLAIAQQNGITIKCTFKDKK